MSPRRNQAQPPTKKPTMWDCLVQASSLVGRVDNGHTFAHAFRTQPCTRIAHKLGTLEDRP